MALRNNLSGGAAATVDNGHHVNVAAYHWKNLAGLVRICNDVYAECMSACGERPEAVTRLDLAQWALVAVERFAPPEPLRREFVNAFFTQFMDWNAEDRAASKGRV